MEFRRIAAGTAALAGVTMLLGVFTAAEGAGLTCAQRWPLCDGPLGGVFPANYLSFVEWFHRVVAGTTGLVVLGTTVAAWRTRQSARIRYAMTVALVVLPVQVVLGMLTVTTYEWLVLVAHFTTATAIFGSLSLAAAWAYDRTGSATEAGRSAALIGGGLAVPAALISPRLLFTFGSAVQVAYYALLLGGFAALLAAAVWLDGGRPTALAGGGAALLAGLLVLGRQSYASTVALGTVLVLVAVACCGLLASRWAGSAVAAAPTISPDN